MRKFIFNRNNLNKEFMRIQIQMFRKLLQRFSSKIHYAILGSLLVLLMFSGCGKDVSVLKKETMEEISEEETISDSDTENSDITDESMKDGKEENLSEEDKSSEHLIDGASQNAESSVQDQANLIYVDVGGAVNNPGVYALPDGSRVFEAIALAGGFTEDAYKKILNQAEILADGQQIYVYTMQEAEAYLEQENMSELNQSQTENSTGGIQVGKVDLNLADKATLMTLSGIGETRADAILQYRSEHGKFHSIEELMQVDGIKGKTYEKIKDCITVQ